MRWISGYCLLGLHHYLRTAMFCHAGEHLRRELVKTLGKPASPDKDHAAGVRNRKGSDRVSDPDLT